MAATLIPTIKYHDKFLKQLTKVKLLLIRPFWGLILNKFHIDDMSFNLILYRWHEVFIITKRWLITLNFGENI